jgi:hypothetical protein
MATFYVVPLATLGKTYEGASRKAALEAAIADRKLQGGAMAVVPVDSVRQMAFDVQVFGPSVTVTSETMPSG